MINPIKSMTNQITYNRLLRISTQILRKNVFELNDEYTRTNILRQMNVIYQQASNFAIKDYRISIKPFDSANPHYVELHIEILFNTMIHYVELNINNVDSI